MKDIKSNIKPCPFCGSEAILENEKISSNSRYTTIKCKNYKCEARITQWGADTESKAIEDWNKRVYEQVPIIEAMQERKNTRNAKWESRQIARRLKRKMKGG